MELVVEEEEMMTFIENDDREDDQIDLVLSNKIVDFHVFSFVI